MHVENGMMLASIFPYSPHPKFLTVFAPPLLLYTRHPLLSHRVCPVKPPDVVRHTTCAVTFYFCMFCVFLWHADLSRAGHMAVLGSCSPHPQGVARARGWPPAAVRAHCRCLNPQLYRSGVWDPTCHGWGWAAPLGR